LGGHSLKVPKLTAAIREELSVDLPLMAIFRTPTVRGLAQHLIEEARFGIDGADHQMVRLNSSPAQLKLFAFPPGRGDALGYTGLARALDGFAEFFGFNFVPRETRLTEYTDAILAEQPVGPFTLFGYSAGGRLAYHVAAELERRGKVVSAVIMADSSRYLAPIPASREEVDRITAEFINTDSVRPYLGTGILRDKAVRLIRAYYDYIYKTVDSWTIHADIHLVTCEGALTVFKDEAGKILASNDAWAEATRNRLVTHQGNGTHNDMFDQPWLDANVDLLKSIVTGTRTDRR
jgi:thioesterase domain-containing protein